MNKKKFLIFFIFLVFFMQSCGLDVFTILYAPKDATLPAESDSSRRVFSFRTNDSENAAISIFRGTDVYYKIYDDKNTCETDAILINNANKEYSDAGYQKLESLGYKQMYLSCRTEPLAEVSTDNRSVEIRLYKEGTYEWGVKIAENDIKDGSENAIPLRTKNNAYENTFDFFNNYHYRDDKTKTEVIINGKTYKNEKPMESDDDFKKSASGDVSAYYVNAYAVSVGMDENFTQRFGELLYLGYVTIKEDAH